MDEDFLKKYLEKRKRAGTFRELPEGKPAIDFLSNDYLGLSRNPALRLQIDEAWSRYNDHFLGGTGSRLLSGNHELYTLLERQLTSLFDAEAVLVFNSGYQANQAVISSLAGKEDVVLYDELSHVCLKEGAWLSRAQTFAFRHNDLSDLTRRLEHLSPSGGRIFVVTETLFSMDGDFAPIEAILEVVESFGAYLIVDEAHSTGVYGARGAGWLVEQGLHQRIFARVYTFGKAIGGHGACVAGSQLLKDFLINAGRSFIYTTSLPPHTICSLLEAFTYLASQPSLAEALDQNISLFRSTYASLFGVEAESTSAIQPIKLFGADRCLSVAKELNAQGYNIMAIRAPTVKPGTERLRICLHSFNTRQEIDGLLTALKRAMNEGQTAPALGD